MLWGRGLWACRLGLAGAGAGWFGRRDPALRELFKPYCLSSADAEQRDSALGLEVHWLWLTKPGPGPAGGAMEGACWRCNLSLKSMITVLWE